MRTLPNLLMYNLRGQPGNRAMALVTVVSVGVVGRVKWKGRIVKVCIQYEEVDVWCDPSKIEDW